VIAPSLLLVLLRVGCRYKGVWSNHGGCKGGRSGSKGICCEGVAHKEANKSCQHNHISGFLCSKRGVRRHCGILCVSWWVKLELNWNWIVLEVKSNEWKCEDRFVVAVPVLCVVLQVINLPRRVKNSEKPRERNDEKISWLLQRDRMNFVTGNSQVVVKQICSTVVATQSVSRLQTNDLNSYYERKMGSYGSCGTKESSIWQLLAPPRVCLPLFNSVNAVADAIYKIRPCGHILGCRTLIATS